MGANKKPRNRQGTADFGALKAEERAANSTQPEHGIELNRFADRVPPELSGEVFSSSKAFSRKEGRGVFSRMVPAWAGCTDYADLRIGLS
jgi:hypothetical protein